MEICHHHVNPFVSNFTRLTGDCYMSCVLISVPEDWMKKMETYKEWFAEQENVKADESKRPGKPKTHDDLFGMEGSFRQLTID